MEEFLSKVLELDLRSPDSADGALIRKAIVHAVLRGSAARKTAERSHASVVGTFASAKMDEVLGYESVGERDLLRLLDVLEPVHAYRPQPFRVLYSHAGREHAAVPDVAIVTLSGNPVVWERKPSDVSPRTIDRLTSLGASLSAIGVPYRITSAREFSTAAIQHNVATMLLAARRQICATLADRVVAAALAGVSTLGALQCETRAAEADLLSLAARGVFAIEIGRCAIGSSSTVRTVRPNAVSGAFMDRGGRA